MKTLKDFITTQIVEEKVPETTVVENQEPEVLELEDEPLFFESMAALDALDPPAVLMMRRKSIRQFPNGQRVAMYYVDKINKYVTVPYTAMQWSASMPEEKQIKVIDHLDNISSTYETQTVKFQDGSYTKVDEHVANAVLKVYHALNEENKRKFSDMVGKSKEHFGKTLDFARKNLK